jgi:hypothetical protein
MSLALTGQELESLDRPALADKYLTALAFVLLGYAIGGRGFAYLGYQPIYIGEIMLMSGIAVLLMTGGWEKILNTTQALMVFPLVFWCALQTFPYLKIYHMDALRDAVLWGYGAFAFIAGGLVLAKPERLARVIKLYRRFALIFLIVMPLIMVVKLVFPGFNPRLSDENPFLFSARRGSMMLHLAAIAVFIDAGFSRAHWLPLAVMPFLFIFSSNRAGMLGFGATLAVAVVLGGLRRISSSVGAVLVIGIILLAVFGDSISIPGPHGQKFTGTQIWDKVESISGESAVPRYGNTIEWRLNWWKDIFNYTVRGKYFWTGKGFGINLADDDGYQIGSEEALRSPHNGHLTFLARAGVPGFALWALVQGVWITSVIKTYWRARHNPERKTWAALFLFLIAYWTASMVQTAFDVELEGPMGGIWFWSMFGIGIAALRIYETNPEVLRGEPLEVANADRVPHVAVMAITPAPPPRSKLWA